MSAGEPKIHPQNRNLRLKIGEIATVITEETALILTAFIITAFISNSERLLIDLIIKFTTR